MHHAANNFGIGNKISGGRFQLCFFLANQNIGKEKKSLARIWQRISHGPLWALAV
jgi:hypothetical protein